MGKQYNTESIKSMLQKGVSEDQLRKQLEEEIASAHKEIEKEKKVKEKNATLDATRDIMVRSIVDYWKALGRIDDGTKLSDKDYKEVCDAIKDVEDFFSDFKTVHTYLWSTPFNSIEKFFI